AIYPPPLYTEADILSLLHQALRLRRRHGEAEPVAGLHQQGIEIVGGAGVICRRHIDDLVIPEILVVKVRAHPGFFRILISVRGGWRSVTAAAACNKNEKEIDNEGT